MRSKAESPPLGPIRTLALYREGEGRRVGAGGGLGDGWEWVVGREGGEEEKKKNC